MNMYTWFLIPWIELLAGVLHIVLFIIFVVVLVTLAPRHSAEWVFLKENTASGWTNSFVAFNLGLMTPTWGFVGKSRYGTKREDDLAGRACEWINDDGDQEEAC
jgi:hypothetical protein